MDPAAILPELPSAPDLRCTVVVALPDRQDCVALQVPPGTTLEQALVASRLLLVHPELALGPLELGVYNHRAPPETAVQDGDRIEIYRPLQIAPMEARRLRAARRKPPAERADPARDAAATDVDLGVNGDGATSAAARQTARQSR